MSQGKKLVEYIDDFLYRNSTGRERIVAELGWETNLGVDIDFKSVYSNHGDYAETQIGTTTLRKGKKMYNDYVDARNDWYDLNGFEIPELTEDEFNQIIGRKINVTSNKNIKTDNQVLLLI